MNKMIKSVHDMEQKMLKNGATVEIEAMGFKTMEEKIAYAYMLGANSVKNEMVSMKRDMDELYQHRF